MTVITGPLPGSFLTADAVHAAALREDRERAHQGGGGTDAAAAVKWEGSPRASSDPRVAAGAPPGTAGAPIPFAETCTGAIVAWSPSG